MFGKKIQEVLWGWDRSWQGLEVPQVSVWLNCYYLIRHAKESLEVW